MDLKKKSDTQFQLLKYIHVGSTASEAELGWEIIWLLKSEVSLNFNMWEFGQFKQI